MEKNERNIKMWSTIGPRATVGIVAYELAKKIENLMVLTCDVSTSAGLDRYRKSYPDKYLDLGIAEQNMIGVAAGLASENYNVITTTFAPFQTMRCCEQIKVNLGYMKQKVTMVGIASGLVLGTLGYTHCCIEDIGVLRSIPNLTIISPADSLETVKALEELMNYDHSAYLRITGSSNNPIVYKKDYDFKIGKSISIKEGKDITIFCTGSMVYQILEASKLLEKENISAKVVNIHTIKPIDKEAILDSCKSKLVVTVEEHNIIGGLGSAVSEIISTVKNSPKQLFLGIKDTYSKGGNYNYLKVKFRLTPEMICEDIKKILFKKN
jgi:transketolase